MSTPASAGARVERPVSVGITGAHSTGKSTFLARLATSLRRNAIEVATIADLGEQCLRAGLPILHSHNYASTLWIMARGISLEVESWPHVDVLLVDRPVPDALAYYLAALDYRGEQPDSCLLDPLHALAAQHSSHYDLILRTVLDAERPLGRNKPTPRDQDTRYRQLADHHVGAVLDHLDIPYRPFSIDDEQPMLELALQFVDDALDRAHPGD